MRILLLNQCFYPDVVSTAQHMKDLALALVRRGHAVTVIAGSRGYDNPDLRFPARETWKGIRIIRVPSLATGKGSKARRALNFASFFLACSFRLLLMPRFDVVVALTSPPLISAMGALFVRMKGGRFIFWVMDLNPDEAIAAGWLKADSPVARVLESILRYSANAADKVIVLDRFMRDRMLAKGLAGAKLAMIPPWSHDEEVRFDSAGRESFRRHHGFTGKYVVMYSGNHSPIHPLDTILEAARQLSARAEIAFCFVGGGSEQSRVRAYAMEHGLRNILCLPYQPLAELSGSLSAADLQLVVLGNPMAGLVHPCKIYNVMAVGIPVLFVGPSQSHVGDISRAAQALPVTLIEHGDVAGAVARIQSMAGGLLPNEALRRAAAAFSAERLLPEYVALVEGV